MYKVFYKNSDGLHSVIKSFGNTDFHQLSVKYDVDKWNRAPGNSKFLAFASLEDAVDFAVHSISYHEATYEIWYCHAREIKPVEYIVTTSQAASRRFAGYVDKLWSLISDGRDDDVLEYVDWSVAPAGTMSCKKIKPIKRVSSAHRGKLTKEDESV